MRTVLLVLPLAALLACGTAPIAAPGGDAGSADAGAIIVSADAGTTASDGGALDAGRAEDGGVTALDAGLASDAGVVPPDAGLRAPDAGPPRPVGPFPPNGWVAASAHNGRVVPWDLSVVDEDALLLPGGRGALYAIGGSPEDHHPDREPLIFVHGLTGAPVNEQPIVDRFWSSTRFQLFTFAFNDFNRRTSLNGGDLADELRALSAYLTRPTRVTIIAHSLGGMVVRWALNQLAVGAGGPSAKISSTRFFGLDNPWHGFDGPADGPEIDFARPFMPDGLEDMRALGGMFAGDPTATDPVLRAGLLGVQLPAAFSIHLVFAEVGDLITDYTELTMADLPERIANAYLNGNPLLGDAKHQHFWNALRSAAAFPALDQDLRRRGGALDAAYVRSALLRAFPRFVGDHTTVLEEHPGERSLLDYLAEQLPAP